MKNKGFTLVEMLAVLVILGLLIGIGVFTVNNIRDNAEKNYYVSMEDTLKIAGNDYFNDNREDRPIDDYNFVSLETLEDHEYLDVLKTYDKKEDCDKSSGVYIYNTETGNEYEVCLKCGIHKSTGLYCNGKKTGQIMITGSTNTGSFYNPTLSYVGTPWSNASYINVTFKLMGEDVSTNKFEIYNGNTNALDSTCTSISANSCTSRMSVTGSYYVIAYNGSEKVGNRKYFNIKIDNTPPTFDIKNQEQEKDLGDGYEFSYNNEVINIHDDNGYKSAVFSLKELVDTNPSVNIVNKDLTASNLQILETLPSGKYRLTVTVTDYAKNSTSKSIEFAIKYNVDMVYFDNTETRHDMGAIRVYTNGFYDGLLTQVTINGSLKTADWYDNTNFDAHGELTYDFSRKVTKTSRHTLYGREKREVIDPNTEPHCNNNNDFTYNASDQELVTAQPGYHVTNNVQTDADTYIIIAMPDENFTWADNTRTYKMIQCTIKRYKVTTPSSPCVSGLVYNGSDQVLIKDAYGGANGKIQAFTPSKDLYTFSPITGKNAGTYNVGFNLADKKNLEWDDGTQNNKSYACSIAKYPVSAPVNPCKEGLVFNNNIQILIKDGYGTHHSYGSDDSPTQYTQNKTSFNEVTYQVTPDSGIFAGDHNISFILANPNNFQWSDGTTANKTFTCKIAKYQQTKPNDPCVSGLVYNGGAQTLIKSSVGTNGSFSALTPSKVMYTYSPTTATNAGTHSVSFSISDTTNVEWSDGTNSAVSYDCKIAKAPVSWDADGDFDVEYCGYNGSCCALLRSKEFSPNVKNGEGVYLDGKVGSLTSYGAWQYNVSVSFSKVQLAGANTNNYYITNPSSTVNINQGKSTVVISTESDEKDYDGTPLTNSNYSVDGACGDTVTADMNSSITNPGEIGNVPTNIQVKYGGNDMSSYVTISTPADKIGKLKVNDKSSPSCSFTVSEAGVYSLTATDNFAIGTVSGSHSGTSFGNPWKNPNCGAPKTTYKSDFTIKAAGTATATVTDCSGNTGSCSITVEKVRQKHTATCKTYKSCATSGCGCDEYNSCATSGCGCNEYKSCATSGCGCNEYKSCKTSGCGCKTYKTCADDDCGCDEYKSCATSGCGCKTYKTCANSDCGCLFTLFGVCFPKTCATSACGCDEYKSCKDSACGCKTYKSCATSDCGCDEYKSCKNSACGCNEYKSCKNSACGCNEYKTCANSACGCKTYKTCADSSCGCSKWNEYGDWVDDKDCVEGESTDHKTITGCREIFRKK